jgi:serine/threonine protein kinase
MLETNLILDPCLSLSEKSLFNANVVYGSNKEIYQNLDIVRPLNQAKFPVYLVQSRITKKLYAMKAFGHENGRPHLHYKNESRFASLRHPNVIRNLFFEDHRKSCYDGMQMDISYIVTEYNSHGDFFHFLSTQGKQVSEKLARTFFRQLIEGIDYLHKNGVAHMDIKLENLLIGNDFNLKIIDFDMSHYVDDALIISHGTKNYRAPEVAKGRCNNPKAADIFSAAVVLFLLKTQGIFPTLETTTITRVKFSELLASNSSEFWVEHCKLQEKNPDFFDDDFRDLFLSMMNFDPNKRASIESIKESKWFNGSYYSPQELKEKMSSLFSSKVDSFSSDFDSSS